MSYASGIMDVTPPRSMATSNEEAPTQVGTKRRWLRTRLLGALVGAFGFGLEVDRAIGYYKHPRPEDGPGFHFLMGLIFLVIAVQNSVLLVSQIREPQDLTKK